MLLGPFTQSNAYSMGVELELQLINLCDFDLTASSPDLIYLLGQNKFPGNFTPEMTESMIEICTGVHTSYSTLLNQLLEIRNSLVSAGDILNIGICGGGTHPFQSWSEQKIYDKERFNQLSSRYGYLAKQFTVFGQHVHIGCPSGSDGLYLLHSLNRYLPHFIALSASSPFVQRNDTLFNSARLNSVFAFPLSGHAPFIVDWEDFDNIYFAKMQKTGTINSMKDFYWDIRPKPEYGTIELRVCDTPLTIEKAAVLAAYLQAICKYLMTEKKYKPEEDDYLVYNYNRFQACRFGMDGTLVHPKTYESILLKDDIAHTLDEIASHSEDLGSLDAIEKIRSYLELGNDANYLREQFNLNGNLEFVVNKAVEKFRE